MGKIKLIEPAAINSDRVKPERCHSQRPIDRETGFEVLNHFERFRQKYDIFNRSSWDPAIKSKKVRAFFESYNTGLAQFRDKVDGFTQRDFALRNAAWHLTDFAAELKEESEDRREGFLDTYTIHRPGSPTRRSGLLPAEMSAEIKRVAQFLGADLVGICDYDERWVYTHNYSRMTGQEKLIDLPAGLTSVIVIANEMDYDLLKTVPSALSGAATGLGYTYDLVVALSLAQYIRNLGYRAVASLNDTALSIPLAVQAGLGEYGRHGLLITKEFGPRVRLGKVFTDLPLAPDKPIRFGVKEFCQVCRRCQQACPPKAITAGEPSPQKVTQSNLQGVRKWTTDPEKCFNFWVNQNAECSICIRVCPYNKEYPRWIYQLGRWLAGTFLRKFMLKLDIWLDYGARKPPKWWWGRAFQ